MAEMPAYLFLCDLTTERECLERRLVGTPQANALWALNIHSGDYIYLFNYNTRIVRGPYTAVSGADCHEASAWRGKFPVQVRVSSNDLTRMADARAPGAPRVLSRSRPAHVLAAAGAEVFSWMQKVGTLIVGA